MQCNHPDSDKYEVCGTLSCPACYYEMLMNPTEQEKKQFEKNLYGRVTYVYDPSKHMPRVEIVYPGDPRYETGLRTADGVKEAWDKEHGHG